MVQASNARQVTLNDFELLMQIGRGAFGVVFLANLPMTGKRYAIKTIRKDKLLETNAIDCIKQEVEILTTVRHKYLCSIDYFFQTELRLFLVMPFIEGGELYRIFKTYKRFTE